jgi:hypothetical protein
MDISAMADTARDLLDACHAARNGGADFPTIWRNVLKDDALVVGPPVQGGDVVSPALEVRLLTGQRLVFRPAAISLE